MGVGGMAQTLTSLSEQFPIISQMAVLFLSAKVAVSALSTAMKFVGVEAGNSMIKTKLSVDGVKQSIHETALATKKWAVDTALAAKTLATGFKSVGDGIDGVQTKGEAFKTLSSNLANAAQNAISLYAAFEGGKAIGTMLREQSDMVRDLGDGMGKALAYLDAMFTSRTFDDVNKHFRTTREQLREQAKLQKQAEAAAKQKAETDKKAAAEQAQKIQALTEQYQRQQRQYNSNANSLKTLTAAGKENGEITQQLRQHNAELETQLATTKAELGKLNAQISDTSPLAKNRQAVKDLGLETEQIFTGISDGAKRALDNFTLAAEGFGKDADSMAVIFQAAVKKMDSPEALAALKKSLNEAGQNAGLTAEQIDKIAQSAGTTGLNLAAISKHLGDAEKAADSLGISLTAALGGSSPEFQAALMKFNAIRTQLDGLAEQGINVGIVLQQSFAKLTENAKTQADIDALKNQIQSLAEAGKLSAEQMAHAFLAADLKMAEIAEAANPISASFKQLGIESRNSAELQLRQAEVALQTIERSGQATETALEQARKKVRELKDALDPTASAFEQLGIKTKEALARSASEQIAAFEKVKASGQATKEDLTKAFQTAAQAALASGDMTQQMWVRSKAYAYDYKVTIDSTGKASLQAASETAQAAAVQTAAYQQVAASAQQAATAQAEVTHETEKTTQAAESSGKKLSELGQKVHYSLVKTGGYAKLGTAMWADSIRYWQNFHINVHKTISNLNQETERSGNIAEWLSKATLMASGNVKVLDKTTLNNLNAAIDKARQKMKQLSDEAANARLEAEKELLAAQGRDDEVRRLEQQEKLNALKAKQEVARKMGNRKASDDYAAAIAAQQKAYAEQAQREQQQREQEQQEAEQQARERVEMPNPDVRVQTNVHDLADLISARDEQVAHQAVQQLEQQLRDALAMQR